MTRKKAIEGALARLREIAKLGSPCPGEVQRELEAMYDQGCIAGMREAASRCFYGSERKNIRDHANALAKKARGRPLKEVN